MKQLRRIILLGFCGLLTTGPVQASETQVSTGWKLGGVPALAYDSDTGFLYGIVLEVYNYGDGSYHPDYLYTIAPTWTRTTKGSGTNEVFFDSKYLLPGNTRITAYAGYLTEQALPFYGFNGYAAPYHPEYEDPESEEYLTRVYYRHDRKMTRVTVDFQKPLPVKNLLSLAGLGYLNITTGPVDIVQLNKGKSGDDLLPDTNTLYDDYVAQGLIGSAEADGGKIRFLKAGIVYDTRDLEPNPLSGLWTEALITLSDPAWGSDFTYRILSLAHRQYFTLIPNDLSFAYRLGYQGVIGGRAPYFILPLLEGSFKRYEGLGGSKTLRGILKNRVVGNAVTYFNAELRWKFYRATLLGQNLYLALNTFLDGGRVVDPYPPGTDPAEKDHWHLSFGAGFRIALNEYFIVAVDFGKATDPQDGSSGLYIGLGYLY
jgi:hypothetical protein